MPGRKYRPVIRFGGNEQEQYFPSLYAGAKSIGVQACQIAIACNTGNRCHGFYWRYAEGGESAGKPALTQ